MEGRVFEMPEMIWCPVEKEEMDQVKKGETVIKTLVENPNFPTIVVAISKLPPDFRRLDHLSRAGCIIVPVHMDEENLQMFESLKPRTKKSAIRIECRGPCLPPLILMLTTEEIMEEIKREWEENKGKKNPMYG